MSPTLRLLVALAALTSSAFAQREWYVGGLIGVSTLSADGRSVVTANEALSSSYKPSNGLILDAFGGVHLSDYISLQASYYRNRNDILLTAIRTPDAAYEQPRDLTQNGVAGDFLVYFRNRKSWVRPYLATGVGVTSMRSSVTGAGSQRGAVAPPAGEFSAVKPTFHSSVGIDLALGKGWAIRYSFLETMQGNPISQHLSPPGERRLADFRNLFGIVKTFRGRTP